MNEKELLELIVKKIDNIENKVDKLESKVDNLESKVDRLEQDNKIIKQELKKLENRLDNLENRLDNLENRFDNLENRFEELETEVKQNTYMLETTVKQCIQLLGEGYQANFEKIDRLNLDSMNSKITQLELLYKFHTGEIDRLKAKIG
ncbi:MAG: hypothetical protein J1F64_06370 [Oscillospiraceae bacterium]|nr:hypothetical protein [Oscillospiraceae bacterium]